jgi:hypothetical protein
MFRNPAAQISLHKNRRKSNVQKFFHPEETENQSTELAPFRSSTLTDFPLVDPDAMENREMSHLQNSHSHFRSNSFLLARIASRPIA